MPVRDDSLVAQYIRNIENPDSIGFRDGMWFQSPRKVDDPNNRGFGVDIRFNEAKELVKGRPGKYLTEEEERTLRNNYISSMEGVLNKWTPKVLQENPSEAKKAMATGMLYREDGVKSIIKDPTLRDAYYSGTDEQFQEAVSNYYNSKGTKHYQPERAKQHNKFMGSHTQEGFNWDNSFKPASSLFEKGGLLEPKDEWDKLSMAAKAEMMKVAVNHGIYDLQTIRQKYNEFAEGGQKESDREYYATMEKVAEDNYKQWRYDNPDKALLHALNDNTYDYKGYYNKYPQSNANATTHWTDEFKTVYHPTFSQESIYSGRKSQYNPLGLPGGFWSGDTFIPMTWQIDANEYKKGGGIHIKPSHRGRLTELKKRTGKTEAELYNDGNPAHKKMVVFARNARRWKHGLGGNLSAEAGQLGHPYYEYDDNGNLILGPDGKPLLTYNARTPLKEIAVTGRKNKGFLEEAVDRFKDVNLAYIDNPAIMTAAGQTAEVSKTHYPTKEEQQLADNLMTIGESGFTAPTLTGDIEAIYQAVRHPIQTAKAVKEGAKIVYQEAKDALVDTTDKFKDYFKLPTKKLLEAKTNYSVSNGFPFGTLDETKQAAELGRQDVLNWQNSKYNKDRWLNYVSNEDADRIIAKQNQLASDPFDYGLTAEELTKDVNAPIIEGGITFGSTKPRPMEEINIDGHTYKNFNTGTDVRIASDIGPEARKTAISELIHHTSGNSIGYPDSGNFDVIVGDWLAPVGLKFSKENTTVMPMGDAWQNLLVKQNNSLMPSESTFSLAVKNAPDDVVNALIRYGETPQDAQNIVDRASYMADIQEQIEHLKTTFLSDIRPHIKNPNDAAEIERFITMHPEIINDDPHLNILVNKLRPGTFKQYAKYFAEALSSLPLINSITNENE